MATILPTDHHCSFFRATRAHLFANMDPENEWVILGVAHTGEVFDVPDWPERLCGLLATQLQDKRVCYSGYLRPTLINGLPAVVMSGSLEQDNPATFAIVQQFVTENRLKIRSARTGHITGEYPILRQKLREYIKG